MTERDKELIRQAQSMAWEDITLLTADTDEAMMQLNQIAVSKHHLAEFECGMI